ncbi:MAG: dienelactone hydrolase family protein [Acidobacteriota bacterium]|nr:dienelactone hydrolase family protein [Acidobacteriota bacterium]
MKGSDMSSRAGSAAHGVSRRKFVAAAPAVLTGLAWAAKPVRAWNGEVEWLDEVQRPPSRLPPEAPELPPLLVGPGGTPIRSRARWESERRRIRRDWMRFLGPMPADRPPLEMEVLEEEELDGTLVRKLVRYNAEAGVRVEGYLLAPAAASERDPRAGVVALHQTSSLTIDLVAGVNGPEEQQIGLKLARRGLVVFCPRCFLWQDAGNFLEAMARFKQRHPEALCMHKMLWDAMRGVDLLASLPQVDATRIGAAGHSLGAIESLYLAAFDERVQVTVASEAGMDFSFTNWHDPWFLGPAIRSPDFKLNHHQLLALAAPRAFLLLAGESGRHAADGDRSWPFIEAALKVYRLYGSPARLGIYNHGKGHTLPPRAFQRMAEWLETYLRVKS